MNLSFRTSGEGTVSIVGATPEDHQKRLEQIEDIRAKEVKNEKIEDEKKGLALPIPGTKAASELASQSNQKDEEKVDELSFIDDLEKHNQKAQNDTIVVGIIVVAIIAGIIGGVIFKRKKN